MTTNQPTFTLNRRHLLGAGAGLGVAGALAACGSGTPGQSATDPTTAGGGSGGAKVTIEFWQRTFTPAENTWYKAIADKFNKSQDKITVKHTEVPADAWDQKMKAAQAAGKAPDIYTHSGSIDDGVRAGQLHELNSIVGEAKLGEIIDSAKPVSEKDGKFYAYPLLLEPQCVLYWNKEMLTKAGLDPEKGPTTWDELFAACDKIKPTLSAGQYCISPAGDAVTFAWSTVGQQFNFAGHTALTDDWGKPNIDNDGYKALMNVYKTMWDKGFMPKQALGAYVGGKEFGTKKCAFKVGGSWMMSEIGSDYKDMLTNTGVGPMVSSPMADGRTATTMGNFKWVVDAKSKNPAAAGEFLGWALAGDPANLVDFFQVTQFTKVPVRKSVQEAVAKSEGAAQAPWSKVVIDQIAPKAIPEPTYPWDVSLAVGTAMESVMKGSADPAKAISTANAAIQKVIDREKLAGKGPKK